MAQRPTSLSVGLWNQYVSEPCPIINPNSITPVTWDDRYFKDNFEVKTYMKERPSLDMLKTYSKLFLNFYVYASSPAKLDEVFMGLISGVKTKENVFITPNVIYNPRGVSLSPGSASRLPEGSSWTSSCQGVIAGNQAGGVNNSGVVPAGGAAPISLSAADVRSWYLMIWEWIEEADCEDEGSILRLQYTINMLGFLAIQLMRLVVKDKNDVARHILGYSHTRVEHFWGMVPGLTRVIPPHDLTLATMESAFDRFSVGGTKILALLVSSYTRAPQDGGVNVKAILRAGCLLGLSGVGMGCIIWLMKAADHVKVSLKEMQSYMACSKFDRTNVAIMTFMRTLGEEGSNIITWPWARLFTDGAYQDLSTKSDPEFAGIMMAVTIGADATHLMWKIPQFAGQFNPINTRICCNYAQSILGNVLVPSVESTMTAQARIAVSGLQRLESAQAREFAAPVHRGQPQHDRDEFDAEL